MGLFGSLLVALLADVVGMAYLVWGKCQARYVPMVCGLCYVSIGIWWAVCCGRYWRASLRLCPFFIRE